VELFGSRTRPAFDELGAARTLSQMVIDAILQRDRAGRLVQFGAHAPTALTLGETLDSLVAETWNRPPAATPRNAALQRVTQRALADRLLLLAADTDAAPEVRALAEYEIAQLRPVAAEHAKTRTGAETRAHWMAIAGDFTRWLDRRELPAPSPALKAPPGDPFGEAP
jgi:hypothetical protein